MPQQNYTIPRNSSLKITRVYSYYQSEHNINEHLKGVGWVSFLRC